MSGTSSGNGGDGAKGAARLAFNPLWLVDAAGVLGAAAYAWMAFAPTSAPWPAAFAAPARELSLLMVGCAVVARVLAAFLKQRDRRGEARRDLQRRLTRMNDALLDLRNSLSRDRARAFLDRRLAFAAGLKLASGWLNAEELKLAEDCVAFGERMSASLTEAVGRRTDFTGAANRLRRTIERAVADGDLHPDDADNLSSLARDGMAVMDVALYAEWNADHYGRLGADRRAFAREIGRYASEAADRIERHGLDLFDQLIAHVRHKVEVVDQILEWDEGFRRLEARLAGLRPPADVVSLDKVRAQRPKLADRFEVATAPQGSVLPERPRVRLPAAND